MFPLFKFIIWGKETSIIVKCYEKAQELNSTNRQFVIYRMVGYTHTISFNLHSNCLRIIINIPTLQIEEIEAKRSQIICPSSHPSNRESWISTWVCLSTSPSSTPHCLRTVQQDV